MTKNKRERFTTIASARTTRVLNDLRLLANCSNRRNYEYAPEDVDQILRAIDDAVKELKSAFITKKPKGPIEFRLGDKK